MAELSNYLEGALLDHLFGLSTFSAPATFYLALSTADPTDDGSGLSEPAGNGYARAPVSAGAGQWTRTANSVANASAVIFEEATGAWGTITHVAIYDAAAGGNLLAHTALDAPLAVTAGYFPRFKTAELTFTLD